MKLLDSYSDSTKSLCAKHKVGELYAIGSVLGSDFNVTCDIDLVEESALKNQSFKSAISNSRKLIYGS
jgi:hypothetical protein